MKERENDDIERRVGFVNCDGNRTFVIAVLDLCDQTGGMQQVR
jgi:hypothetical protein